jgi:hypothetical protein
VSDGGRIWGFCESSTGTLDTTLLFRLSMIAKLIELFGLAFSKTCFIRG